MHPINPAACHDIRDLQRMLQAAGVDNYTHAVCQIALGEADQLDLSGLTDAEVERLRETYENKELAYGWEIDVALRDVRDVVDGEATLPRCRHDWVMDEDSGRTYCLNGCGEDGDG